MKGKRVHLAGMGTALCLLLIVKIVLSGFFLQNAPGVISSPGLAMAENREKVEPAKGGGTPASGLSGDLLKQKEEELKAKEEFLKKKEKELLPLKQEVESKLAELNELESRLTSFAKKLAEREQALQDQKVKHLVDLYAAMDPARAAAIMDKLKIETVVLILRNMKGKAAGQIMAMMKTERGATISEKLGQPE
ncbi:MAG: hypothetical protein JW821_19720 [Deltaproteobacteria bacterium]|nr:hypothetical protein [Deltaproteobacteria bacterium]